MNQKVLLLVVMGLRLRWGKRKEKKRLKLKEAEHSKRNDSFETRYPIKAYQISIFKHQCLTSFDFKLHQHKILKTQRTLLFSILLFSFLFLSRLVILPIFSSSIIFFSHIISNNDPWGINKYMLYSNPWPGEKENI